MLQMNLLDNAEKIDVGIVYSKVNEDGSGSTVNPQVRLKISDSSQRLGLCRVEILHKTTAVVAGDLSQIRGSIQLLLSLVGPPAAQQTTCLTC